MINDSDTSKRKGEGYALKVSPNGGDDKVPSAPPSPQLKAAAEKKDAPGLIAAAAHAAVPTWANMVLMMSLIFGGCCANVSVPFRFWKVAADSCAGIRP
jgi:UDP-xylose/UDP-N-acetylglucosamine transporter B4